VTACPRLEPVDDLALVDIGQHAVARHAAGEGIESSLQVQASDDLGRLLLGIVGANQQPMGHLAALDQAPIAGEERPVLVHGDVGQLGVQPAGVVPHVEAQQPEVPGERPEVDVGHESGLPQRLGPQPGGATDVERLEHREHADAVAVVETLVEARGFAVDHDEVDLGVGHAEGFDGVLHRLAHPELVANVPLPPIDRQQVVQLAVEPELGNASHTLYAMKADQVSLVDVFADVWCPFTHVGLRMFLEHRRNAHRPDVKLRVRAWPLEIVNGEPLSPTFVAEEIEEIQQQAAPELFSGFSPTTFPQTTLPALVLAGHAYQAGLDTGEAVSLELRDLLFEQGVDISRSDVLGAVAAGHDLDAPGEQVDPALVEADRLAGVKRGVTGSPHFFTPAGDFFCPALDIRRDARGHLRITADPEGFDRFLAACFSEPPGV
jgi:hypothetical protein